MSGVWLSRTLLHPIMSEPADAGGKSGTETPTTNVSFVMGRVLLCWCLSVPGID